MIEVPPESKIVPEDQEKCASVFEGGAIDDFQISVAEEGQLSAVDHYSLSAELASFLRGMEECTYVHAFGNGIEIESAGRVPNKSQTIVRNDLAALPFLIAGKNDIVLAPPLSQKFLDHLTNTLGFTDLPLFVASMEDAESSGRTIAGVRPFGVPGDHMRRSNIAKYRDDVIVCTSMEGIDAAVEVSDASYLREAFPLRGWGVIGHTQSGSL